MGNQGGKALRWRLPAHFNFEKRKRPKIRKRVARCPATFPGVWPHFGTLCTQVGAWDEGQGTGLSYTPCLLMKPVLRLRLHATQSQPCFPAASNALALTGGNSIFTATLTERITHYQSRPVIPSPPSDAVPRIAAVLHSTAHHLNLPAFPCPEHCQMIPPHG